MALSSLPLLTSPNSTNLFHTATSLHLCQSPTETRPGGLGPAQPSIFWRRGLPQITYGGGPFQSPTPPKNTYGGEPSLSPTPPPPKNTYGDVSLTTHSHYTNPHGGSGYSQHQSLAHTAHLYGGMISLKMHRAIVYIQSGGCFLIKST